MSLTTVVISIAANYVTASGMANGRAHFELTGNDADGTLIVPQGWDAPLDASGTGTINLWPNGRGTNGTQYRVTLYDYAGALQYSGVCTVPPVPCDLHTILSLAPPASVNDAQTASSQAQAFAAQALAVLSDPGFVAVKNDLTNIDAVAGDLPAINAMANGLIPLIETFASPLYPLIGNGIADDSVAIKVAHDNAKAAGVRMVWVRNQHYAPTLYNAGSVMFFGPGALIGTYRKKVTPLAARTAHPFETVRPTAHFRRAAKALSVVIAIISDSTGSYGADHISLSEDLWAQIQATMLRQNPRRTLTFQNRAIGGTAIAQITTTGNAIVSAGQSPPASWFTDLNQTWVSYVTSLGPDLVWLNFGANSPTGVTYSSLGAAIAALQASAGSCDVGLFTNTPRSSNADSGSAQVTNQEGREMAAGATRSYADYFGLAVLDIGRAWDILVGGFDPCSQVITALITTPTVMALPATLPETQQDFPLIFQIDNTSGTALTSANKIDIPVSPQAGNNLRLGSNGAGALTVSVFTGSGGSTIANVTLASGSFPLGSVNQIEISIRNSFLTISTPQNGTIFEGKFFKHGGKFSPTISYATGSGVSSITVVSYGASNPTLTVPCLTDDEAYGPNGASSFPNGGNGINHPSSKAYQAVYTLALEWADFDLEGGGRPVQKITAAAAINPDAGVVELTGPGSGTYAVTLGPPRVEDQGRPLLIEMASTTGSNSVTLALTNVVNGTASSTCTWNGVNQCLKLVGGASKWQVDRQNGVTLN